MTSAHGQEITKKIHALWIQSAQPPPKINGGKIAKITAPMVTTGV